VETEGEGEDDKEAQLSNTHQNPPYPTLCVATTEPVPTHPVVAEHVQSTFVGPTQCMTTGDNLRWSGTRVHHTYLLSTHRLAINPCQGF